MLKIFCPGCKEELEVPVSIDTVRLSAEWVRVTWQVSDAFHKCWANTNPTRDGHGPGNAVRETY